MMSLNAVALLLALLAAAIIAASFASITDSGTRGLFRPAQTRRRLQAAVNDARITR